MGLAQQISDNRGLVKNTFLYLPWGLIFHVWDKVQEFVFLFLTNFLSDSYNFRNLEHTNPGETDKNCWELRTCLQEAALERTLSFPSSLLLSLLMLQSNWHACVSPKLPHPHFFLLTTYFSWNDLLSSLGKYHIYHPHPSILLYLCVYRSNFIFEMKNYWMAEIMF